MEVTRRRGRRRKKLLDDLKDRRGYSHLKEEALARTMWRNRFGGGFGPVVRQNAEWLKWMNIYHILPTCFKACRRNVVNILLYKYICAYSWYIWGDILTPCLSPLLFSKIFQIRIQTTINFPFNITDLNRTPLIWWRNLNFLCMCLRTRGSGKYTAQRKQ